jgi:hypothetical protein
MTVGALRARRAVSFVDDEGAVPADAHGLFRSKWIERGTAGATVVTLSQPQ